MAATRTRCTNITVPGCDLKGNNDLLSLTQPDIIKAVHGAYLDAGADLIETNTFNSTSISQADYHLEHLAVRSEPRRRAPRARAPATPPKRKHPGKPRFAIGVLGPTSRTASISPDVNNPGFRNVTFEELATAYAESTHGLLDGGADVHHGRNDLRHVECEGRAVRRRAGVRRAAAHACRS